jgi:uncharacterized protein (TIRG00374 family)
MRFTNIKNTLKNQNTIKIIVSLLILVVIFNFINFNLFFETLENINSLFLIVLLLIPVNILIRAWRLSIILNKDEKLISINDSFYLNLAGIALNLFMPASSGDIVKSYYGYKWHGIKEEMLSANIFDKFMALFSVFVVGGLAALLIKLYLLSLFSIILALLFVIIFFYPDIMPWNTLNKVLFKLFKIKLDEEKLKHAFIIPNKIKIKTFIISIIGFLTSYVQVYLLCLSFSIAITFTYILAIAPLMNLAILFPFTFNGLGSGEAVVIYLFGLIGISTTIALLLSLLTQIVSSVLPGIVGFLIILKKR